MRFEANHHLSGSPGAVATTLADPDFYLGLRLPDLSQPEVLDQGADGPRVWLRLRYVFEGSLDPVAQRLVGKRQLAWLQTIDINRTTGVGDLDFQAEAVPKRLHGSAHFTLTPDGAGCLRRLSGELVVAVPVVRARAERQIVAGLLRRLDLEAAHLDTVLGG